MQSILRSNTWWNSLIIIVTRFYIKLIILTSYFFPKILKYQTTFYFCGLNFDEYLTVYNNFFSLYRRNCRSKNNFGKIWKTLRFCVKKYLIHYWEKFKDFFRDFQKHRRNRQRRADDAFCYCTKVLNAL